MAVSHRTPRKIPMGGGDADAEREADPGAARCAVPAVGLVLTHRKSVLAARSLPERLTVLVS